MSKAEGAPTALQAQAEALGSGLPALMAEAEMLAQHVMLGEHGRRRAGQGDEFWQYRAAHPGDPARLIDWRRSARSDGHFVREREWQAAQSVSLWVDPAKSMGFSGDPKRQSKHERAKLLALALGVLLLRAGERVGLSGSEPPRAGRAQVFNLAMRLSHPAPEESTPDYGAPHLGAVTSHGRAVFLSDFLGPIEKVEAELTRSAAAGLKGVMLQVLDPAEEDFPFDGRTIFQSMAGSLSHETRKAGDLRSRYLERLAERREALRALARAFGWQFSTHHTGTPAQMALLWLYNALEGRR